MISEAATSAAPARRRRWSTPCSRGARNLGPRDRGTVRGRRSMPGKEWPLVPHTVNTGPADGTSETRRALLAPCSGEIQCRRNSICTGPLPSWTHEPLHFRGHRPVRPASHRLRTGTFQPELCRPSPLSGDSSEAGRGTRPSVWKVVRRPCRFCGQIRFLRAEPGGTLQKPATSCHLVNLLPK